MQFKIALLLPALALAAPTPTENDAAAATTTTLAVSCVYSSLPTATAYAALMPNPNLNSQKINQYFNDFSFACEGGTNFEAKQLSVSGQQPWFGGDKQTSSNCSPPNFADVVYAAMQDGGHKAPPSVDCVKYNGETSDAFGKAASAYFKSLV